MVPLNSGANSNVTFVNSSLTLLPKLKQKPFRYWMTSFIWLSPMADVIGIFCFSPWRDWKVWRLDYFLLLFVSSESNSSGPSKSVCGYMSSQERWRTVDSAMSPLSTDRHVRKAVLGYCSFLHIRKSPLHSLLCQSARTLTLADILLVSLCCRGGNGPFCP